MNLITNIGEYPCAQGVIRWELKLTVTPEVGYENVEYTIKIHENGTSTKQTTKTGVGSSSKEVKSESGNQIIEVFYEIETSSEFAYTADLKQEEYVGFFLDDTYNTTASANSIQSTFVTSNNMPKLKLIDFLKGLFKMFKLVVCLLYTSPSPRDRQKSRMPSSA